MTAHDAFGLTRVINAARNPMRDEQQAMLVEEPPMYLAKLATSSRRLPICCA